MGTRGTFGFVADGQTKISYNHYDSYPSGLGNDVLAWVKAITATDTTVAEAMAAVIALEAVDANSKPTAEQAARCAPFTDGGVSTGDDWYAALRGTQGDPARMLEAGFYTDDATFPADSLFCEWGYIVDFDYRKFEVYKGFQKEVHALGRFATDEPNDGGYYPIRLIKSYSFDGLPDSLDSLENDDEDDDDETPALDVTNDASTIDFLRSMGVVVIVVN